MALTEKYNNPYLKTQTVYHANKLKCKSIFFWDIRVCLGIPGMSHTHTYGGYWHSGKTPCLQLQIRSYL